MVLWTLAALAQVPSVQGPVSDYSEVVDPADEAKLEASIRAIREKTGVQIAIVTTWSLPWKVPLEDFSLQIAEQWGGGDSDRDDGILVLLLTTDRLSRIEVGYGLEGYLTDGEAGALLTDAVPHLKEARYGLALQGIVDGIGREVESLQPGVEPPVWRQGFSALVRALPRGPWIGLVFALLTALLATLWQLAWFRGPPKELSAQLPDPYVMFGLGWVVLAGVVSMLWFLLGFDAIWLHAGCGFAFGAVVAGPLGSAPDFGHFRGGVVCFVLSVVGGLLLELYVLEPSLGWMLGGLIGVPLVAAFSLEGGEGGGGGGGGTYADSQSSSSSYSSSSSSSSSSGSSGGSDWGGGGGGFGGGGASGSW